MFLDESTLAWLKRHPRIYDFVRHQLYARLRSLNRRKIFRNIYGSNYWDGRESVSGIGSSLSTTEGLRASLPAIISKLEIRSLLDIPCGDFNWMRHIDLGLERYIGADLVPAIVERNIHNYSDRGVFICLDIMKDNLPKVDSILCRDCLVHFSIREVHKVLHNIGRATPRYLMITTFPGCSENIDTVLPYWRPLNFEIAPFNFPTALDMIRDFSTDQRNDQGKYLAIWKAADLSL